MINSVPGATLVFLLVLVQFSYEGCCLVRLSWVGVLLRGVRLQFPPAPLYVSEGYLPENQTKRCRGSAASVTVDDKNKLVILI